MSKILKLNILASYPPPTTSLMDYHGYNEFSTDAFGEMLAIICK